MNELANKIQIVINTIQDLDIKSTFDNMNHLMGALKTLAGIRDELKAMNSAEVVELFADGEKVEEERKDGNADAE